MNRILIILLPFSFPLPLTAQAMLAETRVLYTHDSGQQTELYAGKSCESCYYYIPEEFNLARKPSGVPELSLLTWKNDNTSKTTGGILHVLALWGISVGEEEKITRYLKARVDSTARVMGPAAVTTNGNTFMTGSDALTRLLAQRVNAMPKAPSTPGAKMALSFRFREEDMEVLEKGLAKPGKVTTRLTASYRYYLTTRQGGIEEKKKEVSLRFSKIFNQLNQQL